MISELTVAMVGKVGLRTLANTIHPYPTQAEAIKKVADNYNRSRLTPRLAAILRVWFRWWRRGRSGSKPGDTDRFRATTQEKVA
jgi:hypothetical protein